MPPILERSTSFSSRSVRHRGCFVRQRTSVELPEKKEYNSLTFPFVNNNLPVAATKCICGNPHSSVNFIFFEGGGEGRGGGVLLLAPIHYLRVEGVEGSAMFSLFGKNSSRFS